MVRISHLVPKKYSFSLHPSCFLFYCIWSLPLWFLEWSCLNKVLYTLAVYFLLLSHHFSFQLLGFYLIASLDFSTFAFLNTISLFLLLFALYALYLHKLNAPHLFPLSWELLIIGVMQESFSIHYSIQILFLFASMLIPF